ncbi:MAG: dihydrolipoyl dehydrogenase [Pseudomonadota bacterium]|nr:dihydrolipoyl dehydrogenase [Pseudomonadota bacterium]
MPDIGDFKDVPIIEILVKPGDTVALEDSLVTLESDKATLDVPAPAAGTVREVKAKLGDKVSQGSLLVLLDPAGAEVAAPAPSLESAADAPGNSATGSRSPRGATSERGAGAAVDRPAAAASESAGPASTPGSAASHPRSGAAAGPSFTGTPDIECEMLVLGAGPGGYSAAFRAADLGMKTVLIERYATLGGVCLNVGCIPSKALLHIAAVMDEVKGLAAHGIAFGDAAVDIDKLRAWKSKVVGKLTGGLAGMAKARKVEVVRGYGTFIDPHHMSVQTTQGSGQERSDARKVVRFEKAIVAAGSQAVKLPFFPDDPRIVDSTGALEMVSVPKRMLVVGGGIIGLEMATVYSALGTRIDVVEMLDGLMQGADRDLVRVWEKLNRPRFDRVMLKTKTTGAEITPAAIRVRFEGEQAPPEPQDYELVLVAVGRSANGKLIGAENAGLEVSARGFVTVDEQMRTNVPHIFAIGDVVGQPMLAHKAVHEGHVAAEAAAGQKAYFDARVIPSVAYTDPEVAWVGVTEDEAKASGRKIEKAVFPWAASGRAIANGRDEGFTKLLFDADTHRIVGGGIVGTHAGDLISEIVLAVEMGADAVDIARTIHPHPTLSESVGLAAEFYEGVCTDLPPARKR